MIKSVFSPSMGICLKNNMLTFICISQRPVWYNILGENSLPLHDNLIRLYDHGGPFQLADHHHRSACLRINKILKYVPCNEAHKKSLMEKQSVIYLTRLVRKKEKWCAKTQKKITNRQADRRTKQNIKKMHICHMKISAD